LTYFSLKPTKLLFIRYFEFDLFFSFPCCQCEKLRKLGLEVGAAMFAFEEGFVKTVGSVTLNQLIALPAVSAFLSGK
jgi:hypothetical protein